MIHPIIQIGDPRLTQVSQVVENFEEIRPLVDDMFETMYQSNGIGLAAVQIGALKRIFIVDIPEVTVTPLVLINPELIQSTKDQFQFEEGCLSIPGVQEWVSRPRSIRISFFDQDQQKQEILAEELLSTCIQHELDHLNGILFPERIDKKDIKKMKEKLTEKNFPTFNLAEKTH